MAITSAATNLLGALLPEWHLLLQEWSACGRLTAAAQEALLLNGEPQALQDLITQWSTGEFGGLPPIVLLSSADINGAMGAYAISTGTIYLNADWLAGASKEQMIAVLTEELGHHLDGLLNAVDTPGDEGEYFTRLLTKQTPSRITIATLRNQTDKSTILVGDQPVEAETASTTVVRGNSLYTIVGGPSWNDAEANSVKLGGHLVTIDNVQENAFVLGVATQNSSGWIGLSDPTGSNNWVWSSNSTGEYRNWAPGQPNFIGIERWAAIYYGNTDTGIYDGSRPGDWGNAQSGPGMYNSAGIAETPFIRRGDSAYVIVQGPTWEEAEANAVKLGGHLVTINDAAENEWITKEFSKPQYF